MAAQRTFPDYNDMADNKAYLESIARSFGYFFGKDKKVRVNTISQSPTATTAGQGVKRFLMVLLPTPMQCRHWVMLPLKIVLIIQCLSSLILLAK